MECTGDMDPMRAAPGGFRSRFQPSTSLNTNFDAPLQPDFEDPPAPSGNPLLDNNELQYLTTFLLGGVNGDHHPSGHGMDSASFPELFNSHHIHTEDWRTPFEVVGHNVSYGAAQVEDGIYAGETDLSPAILGSLIPSSATEQLQQANELRNDFSDVPGEADAFAAALALTNAGQFDRSYDQAPVSYSIASAQNQMVSPADSQTTQQPLPYRMAAPQQQAAGMRNQPVSNQPTNSQFSFSPPVPQQNGRTSLGAMPLGSFGGGRLYGQRPRAPLEEVRFGSDPNFNQSNFVPNSAKDTTEALSAMQMETLKCLQRTDSAAPTRATSPVSFQPLPPNMRRDSFAFSPGSLRTAAHHHLAAGDTAHRDDGSARKRRKSNKESELYSAEVSAQALSWASLGGLPTPKTEVMLTATAVAQRRKLPGPDAETISSAATPADATTKPPRKAPAGGATSTPQPGAKPKGRTARRTPAAGPKPRRQNLTKEEKRQRHNQSEQRRRGYTKDNYEALKALIPEVRTGRYSKAATLRVVANLLEEMHAGNDALRRRLDEVCPGQGDLVRKGGKKRKKKERAKDKKRGREEMERDGMALT